MNLKMLISVSGNNNGIFKIVSNRKDGLIVESIADAKKQFLPTRGNQFVPVESISIYTEEEENEPLKNVFAAMLAQLEAVPLPDAKKASNDELRAYLTAVMPHHNKTRVYASDIKKLVKWFDQLHKAGILHQEDPEDVAAAESDATITAD